MAVFLRLDFLIVAYSFACHIVKCKIKQTCSWGLQDVCNTVQFPLVNSIRSQRNIVSGAQHSSYQHFCFLTFDISCLNIRKSKVSHFRQSPPCSSSLLTEDWHRMLGARLAPGFPRAMYSSGMPYSDNNQRHGKIRRSGLSNLAKGKARDRRLDSFMLMAELSQAGY